MMSDLVDQHMRDDGAERLLVLGPIIEDWTAVEKYHVRQRGDVADALPREIDARIEAEQVEGRLDPHLVEDLVGGKVLDTDQEIAGKGTEAAWQTPVGGIGDRLEFGEARRLELVPVDPAHGAIIPGCPGPREANLNRR